MGGVLVLRLAMLCPGTALYIISCDSPGMTSLETSKATWRARLGQFRAEEVENLARERQFPDPCEQSIKENVLGQTMKCMPEGYDVSVEGMMNYDYERELRRVGEGFEKVMVLVGENTSLRLANQLTFFSPLCLIFFFSDLSFLVRSQL
jgi:hypothetical protein